MRGSIISVAILAASPITASSSCRLPPKWYEITPVLIFACLAILAMEARA